MFARRSVLRHDVPVRLKKRQIPKRGEPLGRTARLLELEPPLFNGGHCFVSVGEGWWQCVGCWFVCPTWVLREGFVTTHAGRYCPAIFKMLETAHAQ